jgi:hypothetical protein
MSHPTRLKPKAKSSDSSMDVEEESDRGNETDDTVEFVSEDDEDLGGPSAKDISSILKKNPGKAAVVSDYLSGDFMQSVGKIASLSGGEGVKGKKPVGKPPASVYADVVKKKKRRRSIEEESPEKAQRTKERTKEEYAALKKDLISHYAKTQAKTWKGSIGGGQGGKFAKGATVKSAARSYQGERAKQFLHQICVRLYDYASHEARAKPTEVQALFVKNRMVFAANEDLAASMLASFKKQNHGSLLALLTEPPVERSKEHAQIEHARYQDMLNAQQIAVELAGEEEEFDPEGRVAHISEDAPPDDAQLLDEMFDSLMYGSASESWSRGNVSEAVTWLRRGDTERGVFWCDPSDLGGDIHAEQALAVVLFRAYRNEPATITGTMRPCVGCYLTLLYGVKKLGLKLAEPKHPGGFWKGTQVSGFIAMIEARELMFAQIHDAVIRAAAESDEEPEEEEPAEGQALDEFRQFVSDEFPKKTFATAYLKDQSGPSEKGPAPHFRRTFTRSESDFAEMMEWAKQQQDQPKKVATKKSGEDDDSDYEPVVTPKKVPAKKPVPKKPAPKKQPGRKQSGRKPVVRGRSRADEESNDDSEE